MEIPHREVGGIGGMGVRLEGVPRVAPGLGFGMPMIRCILEPKAAPKGEQELQ